MSYVKSQTTIGSTKATVFQCQASGEYFYSLSSVSELVSRPTSSASDFFKSKSFKANRGGNFEPRIFSEAQQDYKLISCDVALDYLVHWCGKGDKQALAVVMALAKESLEIRAASAFNSMTLDKVREIHQATNEELATEARREAREEHMSFQRACWQLGFQPATTHDYLTTVVFGTTAIEAIKTPLTGYSDTVWQNELVGINHHPDPLLMKLYRQVKKRCMSYTKGTYQERINRAYMELTEGLKVG